jgi:hypothetical protein
VDGPRTRVFGPGGEGTEVSYVDEVNGLPQAERATGADLVHDFADNVLIRNFGVFGNSEASR